MMYIYLYVLYMIYYNYIFIYIFSPSDTFRLWNPAEKHVKVSTHVIGNTYYRSDRPATNKRRVY